MRKRKKRSSSSPSSQGRGGRKKKRNPFSREGEEGIGKRGALLLSCHKMREKSLSSLSIIFAIYTQPTKGRGGGKKEKGRRKRKGEEESSNIFFYLFLSQLRSFPVR